MPDDVLKRFVDRLTDNYNKNENSNVYKLLQLAAEHIQENEDTLNRIMNWRDIDQAEGVTLDLIGRNVRQNRGQAPDEVYRILIKSKIKRNFSNGSINTLIDFLSFILQIDKKEVVIHELYEVGQPATLKIDLPIGAIAKTGLTRNQFGALVNIVTVAGVKANVLFEGTFSFSADYYNSEYDNPNGFADDAGTTGGTLGDSYDPGNDYELPL